MDVISLLVLLGLPFALGWAIGDSVGHERGLRENQAQSRHEGFLEGVREYRVRVWLLANNRPYNDPINQDMLNAIDADLETRLRQGQG